jgi:hypothetical protein
MALVAPIPSSVRGGKDVHSTQRCLCDWQDRWSLRRRQAESPQLLEIFMRERLPEQPTKMVRSSGIARTQQPRAVNRRLQWCSCNCMVAEATGAPARRQPKKGQGNDDGLHFLDRFVIPTKHTDFFLYSKCVIDLRHGKFQSCYIIDHVPGWPG